MSRGENVIYLGPGAQAVAEELHALMRELARVRSRQHRRDCAAEARISGLERMVAALVDRLVALEKGGER